jgi:hypothetical protein
MPNDHVAGPLARALDQIDRAYAMAHEPSGTYPPRPKPTGYISPITAVLTAVGYRKLLELGEFARTEGKP